MKQNKLFSGTLSKAKAFLLVAVMSLPVLSANAQTPTRVGVTGVTEVNTFYTEKVYDGTTVLPMNPAATITLTGVAEGDSVVATAVGNYVSSTVDTNIAYNITFTLSGPDASSYYIDTTISGNNGRITPKQLFVSSVLVPSIKVYDGTTICSQILFEAFTGVVAGDNVTYNAVANFSDPNVGTMKRVTIVYSINGPDAANYNAPRADSSYYADIVPKPIHITGIAIDTAKIYDGTTTAQVINHGTPIYTEVLLNDTVMPVTATANYLDANVGTDKPVVVTYVLNGPQAANYEAITDSTLYADIVGRTITVEGAAVRLCKEYDGTSDALVLQAAYPTNLVSGDNVPINTVAFYDTPDTGHNKTIYLGFSFADNSTDQLNYILPDSLVYSHVGKIILSTELDENGFYITTDGTCMGDDINVNYTVVQGEPVVYYIAFPPEALALGFTNVDSVALPGIGEGTSIPIHIPDNCPFGHYYADITLVNEADATVTYRFNFTVNYSNEYVTDIFFDVVSIVNVEELFNTYQWYHNGVAIEGATLPYYQEEGGLTGTYYVVVNAGTETEGRTCDKSFNNVPAKTVKVSPNPVSTTAKVSLYGFGDGNHVIAVFNSYGQQVLNRTFSGIEFSLDLTNLPQGTYLVTVDGEKAKVLKF